MCCNNIKSNFNFTEVIKSAFEFLKVQIIFALVLLVRKSAHEAEYVVVIDATKIAIVGVLILMMPLDILRSCIY